MRLHCIRENLRRKRLITSPLSLSADADEEVYDESLVCHLVVTGVRNADNSSLLISTPSNFV